MSVFKVWRREMADNCLEYRNTYFPWYGYYDRLPWYDELLLALVGTARFGTLILFGK